jgi:hypothetical protein
MMNSPSQSAPLRDRLLLNSPTADSNGWIQQQSTSSSHSSAVSPLRIAKRDTPTRKVYPTQLARRTSSSYTHVRNNNLVSKSPFRSNLPTPARISPSPSTLLTPTRRISGEKRPRPSSMHDQAENEHPLGFKRRQSKGFQGLVQKEPVTNSPFRRTPQPEDSPPPPVPQKLPLLSVISPSRPSLVTKRFHGPRTVALSFANGKRQRRKTVTFDERCDVVEFDRDEDQTDDEDQYMYEYEQGVEAEEGYEEEGPNEDTHDQSFDDRRNPDDSITGLVDSMLEDAQADIRPHTPPKVSSIPVDLETEDGIPLGRTHHADRLAAYHEQTFRHEDDKEEETPAERSYIWSSSSSSPATPPGPLSGSPVSPGSHPPRGRTSHSERAAAAHRPDELEGDLQMLPPSPSPAKKAPTRQPSYSDELIPSFGLQVTGEHGAS